jgi:uncharacterized membrane protein
LLTAVVAVVLMFFWSHWLPEATRVVLAWNAGVAVVLALIATMIWQSDAHKTRTRARSEKTTNIVILLITIATVAGAVMFIAYGLSKAKGMSHVLGVVHIWLSIAGVLLSWLLLHTMYSLHYAKLYYGRVNAADPMAFTKGLTFPSAKDELVDYWDFVYYAFTIAMCFQTSDITITSPRMRRLTIFHATISYFFALVILGLLLNIIANVI